MFNRGNTPMQNAPGGENTREAREIALLRTALAAQIKQGKPMADLIERFTFVTLAEGMLLDTQARQAGFDRLHAAIKAVA